TGAQLSYLVKKYGFPFVGRFEREAFPLLLKFIDAKDKLSIQVHPDDRYAHDNEHGKLGKTEAWLILDAPEGSQLVYGIKPGVTKEELRAACEKGSTVEELIRFVDVKPGDVCMIPSGCVHAIGAGIMLYEIQQSSDITYRFYDWDRVDKNGKKRELHLEKALDVTDLTIQRDPIPAPESGVARVLDETYFTLDLMHVDGSEKVPAIGEFGILTALDSELTLTWEGEEMTVHKGETLFVPRSAPALTLKGQGCAALSMPR
ncbi:MAG: class I mannose-6-phosphate isomerase, partial [Clostridia bacterium]|nr:class I mannose-6-phosphate isomerase [Clostridia bacterium]